MASKMRSRTKAALNYPVFKIICVLGGIFLFACTLFYYVTGNSITWSQCPFLLSSGTGYTGTSSGLSTKASDNLSSTSAFKLIIMLILTYSFRSKCTMFVYINQYQPLAHFDYNLSAINYDDHR